MRTILRLKKKAVIIVGGKATKEATDKITSLRDSRNSYFLGFSAFGPDNQDLVK